MRYFCVTLGNEESCSYFYVNAERIEQATILCTGKPGDIRFYVGSKIVCFVDHYKVYEIEEILNEDVKVIYKGGKFV